MVSVRLRSPNVLRAINTRHNPTQEPMNRLLNHAAKAYVRGMFDWDWATPETTVRAVGVPAAAHDQKAALVLARIGRARRAGACEASPPGEEIDGGTSCHGLNLDREVSVEQVPATDCQRTGRARR